jgi:hypothetical protein
VPAAFRIRGAGWQPDWPATFVSCGSQALARGAIRAPGDGGSVTMASTSLQPVSHATARGKITVAVVCVVGFFAFVAVTAERRAPDDSA